MRKGGCSTLDLSSFKRRGQSHRGHLRKGPWPVLDGGLRGGAWGHVTCDIGGGTWGSGRAYVIGGGRGFGTSRGCRAKGDEASGGRKNRNDRGLNLSGSWQQGHSATYNTRRVFKSSVKDFARRPMGIILQSSPRCSSAVGLGQRHIPLGAGWPLLRVDKRAPDKGVASGPNSNLEAFSYNPAHSSSAPLAFQPSAMTNFSELTVRRLGKDPGGAIPKMSPGQHAATALAAGVAQAVRQQSTSSGLGPLGPALRANYFQGYGSILPTFLAYIIPLARGCSPWRPDAVMSTSGLKRHPFSRLVHSAGELLHTP
ncbi:hypothetical protein GH714_032358 [Hevea brasiliensis]|uniref:Uncharacterized protein n=1 Tax=Hevea brasiliensis TaxID=3981 RepID=A0A6A6LGB2_HEVBR|nr:hypothetical protein GH714_032358 [Hevea brasiliensis]